MPPPPSAEGLASRLLLGPALRAQPDQRLVRLVREGYEAAFEEIVRRYGKPLQRYAAAIVGGRAEDVTQDAFSKALLALRRDDKEIQLRPWLYRIVRNTALNDIRDRPPPAQILEEAIQSGVGPQDAMERRAEITDLMKRLRSLPEPQRAAIVMRELEGLSHEEIAAALGLSDGAARQAIYRARQALRDGLGLLIPLPLVRMLAEHGSEAAVAAGAGGAALAGVGTATKLGVVTVLVAGSVGAGVALEGRSSPEAVRAASEAAAPASAPEAPAPAEAGGEGPGRGDRARRGEDGEGDGARLAGIEREGPEAERPRHDFAGLSPPRRERPHRGPGGGPGPGVRSGPGRFPDTRPLVEPERDDRPGGDDRLDDREGGGERLRDDREPDSSGHGEVDEPRDEEDRSGPGDGDRTTDAFGDDLRELP